MADVVVFGIPNAEWDEDVKAVVELLHGQQAPDDEVQETCKRCTS